MPVRVIHTADLQIGKGFGRFPPEIAGRLRTERLETVKRIAALATDRQADAVLVAGDCFDDVAVADETLRRFRVALEPFAGPWVLLPGNHDPAIVESPWSRLRRLGLPENVNIADQPRPIELPRRAVVLPAPLTRRRDAADVSAWFEAAHTEEGVIRIGLAHGSVAGFLPEASEAANPIARDRAARAKLDYLALGDWHGCLEVDQRSWYAGTPEPDRFRSNDPGYVLEVTIDGPGALPHIEPIRVAGLRWIERSLEVTPGGGEEVLDALGVPDGELERCVARLELRGVVDLASHAAALEALEELRSRVVHLEAADDHLIIEPSQDDLDAIAGTGFVGEALQRLRAELAGPQAARARRALALLYGLQQRGG